MVKWDVHFGDAVDAVPDQEASAEPGGEPNADPLASMFKANIILSESMFRDIIDACEAKGLGRTGTEMATSDFSKILEAYGKEGIPLNFEEIMDDILSRYFRMFRIEGRRSSHKGNPVTTVTLSHRRGLKWSIFLRSYLQCAYGMVSKEGGLEIDIDDEFVHLAFHPPDRERAQL
jgi:hypothetical protein